MTDQTANVDPRFPRPRRSHPQGLIVERLSQGPISVSSLAKPLHITLAAVVQHLQVLEESRLVYTCKAGRVRTCHIEPAGLSM